MMKALLDTHIVLWAVADSAKLPEKIKKLLESEENDVYYSTASVWEVAIKHKIRSVKDIDQAKSCAKTQRSV